MKARSLLVFAAALFTVMALSSPTGALAAAGDWPTYHRDTTRAGNDPTLNPITALASEWTSNTALGDMNAEPLVVTSTTLGKTLVIGATQGDWIFALDASSGAVVWQTQVGTPVSGSVFNCGNIDPQGITGTPVVDTSAGVVYAVDTIAGPVYQLVGLDLATGNQKFAPVTLPVPANVLLDEGQRSALSLANGYVYIPFGGRNGDCQPYHGYVFAVPASGSGTVLSFVDQPATPCSGTSGNEAGFWAASGAAVDGSGNVYVTSGNGSDGSTYDCGETVFKLSSSLTYLDSFAPSNVTSLNAGDTDLGSAGPLLLKNGWLFQAGKEGVGFLLNTAALSSNANHIGGEAFSNTVCPTEAFGGFAYSDPFIYVPCDDGLYAIQVTGLNTATPSFTAAWNTDLGVTATTGPETGPPIVAGGVVWVESHISGDLYGLDPATGNTLFSAHLNGITHFNTPASGAGHIYVSSGQAIEAFGQGPGRYHPLTPARLYDSRNPGQGPLGFHGSRNIQVTGQQGVPSSGVAAVVMNVTVTGTTAPSYLTVFPTGAAQPVTSNLNWVAGQTVANLVEVGVGSGGQVTAYNSAGSTQFIFDVAGWVSVSSATPGVDGLYNPQVPARILDTRTPGSGGALGAGATRTLAVAGHGGVPSSGVEAVVLNVTATGPTAASFLTIYPTGAARPLVSNLNFTAGQTVPNRVVVKLGTSGQINIYNSAGSVQVVVDVNGWFTDTTAGGTGSQFVPMTPDRILDTRSNIGGFSSPVGSGQTIAVQVAGQGGVPAIGSATPPSAVVMNVTVTGGTKASYLTVWPDAAAQPLASDLNFVPNQTVPNLVVVKVNATNGKVDIFNSTGSVNVIADVMGWYG